MLYVNPKLNTGTKRYQLTVLQFGWLIFFYFILTIEQKEFHGYHEYPGNFASFIVFLSQWC